MKIFSAVWAMAGIVTAGGVPISVDPQASPRELYGASRLRKALESPAFHAPEGATVIAAVRGSSLFANDPDLPRFENGATEAFRLRRVGSRWLVIGSDPSGVLYGCMELARQSAAAKTLPEQLDMTDKPAFAIRGTNLFWMKRGNYDWGVVPKEFPWFFDRTLMTRYLDELADNRFNAIFFWNGHPFPYFLRLEKYPEARVLSEADLERNIEYLKWFTAEADRRGLWTVFHFYNIHVSPNFAKAHQNEGVKLQNSASTPLLQAYMRYCVSEFAKSYPSVGLMLTAGEALSVKAEEYVRDTIIPGLKDTGLKPPLIVRQWTIDPYRYRDIIRPNYDNLYTMMKHNTEMVVSPHPDPRNQTWMSYGQHHIINLHELGDLKPFRWGSPVWIQQMTTIWKNIGASGFHLYPMTSWMWPESLDRADPPLSVIDRDRIWIEAFGRYGWNPERPQSAEKGFWQDRIAERFGSEAAGKAVYEYYVKTGPIMPGIQNVVNVFNMNYHPTAVSQEATLNGILHSNRWEGVGDYLARPLDEYTLELYEKRYGKLPPDVRAKPPLSVKEVVSNANGIDPVKLSELFVSMATESLAGLNASRNAVRREDDEYGRFIRDNECLVRFARFYRAKLEAAIEKGRFDRTGDTAHYEKMLSKLDESLSEYKALTDIATAAYRHATDLGDYYKWTTVRDSFEAEAAFYHSQSSIAGRGGDIVYFGPDGPVNDATNAFHWTLEQARSHSGKTAQSYALGKDPLARAKLAVVYDLSSPAYKQHEPAIETWIRNGGKLLVWDPAGRATGGGLLSGIEFQADTSHRTVPQFAFLSSGHALTQNFSASTIELPRQCLLSSSIQQASPEWHELAYTVLGSVATHQFYTGDETFGPRWTSLMDPQRAPLLLVKQYGKGEVAIAQLSACSLPVRAEPPPFLRQLVDNLLHWASL